MTVAERDELLDAVEGVERVLEQDRDRPTGIIGPGRDALQLALADLFVRALRVWLVSERPVT